jgi:hypothetical protein
VKPAAVISPAAHAPINAPSTNAASADAIKAYNGYLAAYVTAAATADWKTKALDKYAADPLHQQALVQLRNLADAGHVMKGHPTSNPHVATVNTTTSPQSVLLFDCVGMAHWTEVVKATGKPAAASRAAYEAVSVVVVNYPGHGWLVQQSNQSKAAAC